MKDDRGDRARWGRGAAGFSAGPAAPISVSVFLTLPPSSFILSASRRGSSELGRESGDLSAALS
jgi:hypothetical protein